MVNTQAENWFWCLSLEHEVVTHNLLIDSGGQKSLCEESIIVWVQINCGVTKKQSFIYMYNDYMYDGTTT